MTREDLIFKKDALECLLGILEKEKPKPSLPTNLDEAANEYALDVKAKPFGNLVKEAFKAGAQWQKEQMMKEAVEAEVFDFSSSLPQPYAHISLTPNKYHIGDKVRIIIIKEE